MLKLLLGLLLGIFVLNFAQATAWIFSRTFAILVMKRSMAIIHLLFHLKLMLYVPKNPSRTKGLTTLMLEKWIYYHYNYLSSFNN